MSQARRLQPVLLGLPVLAVLLGWIAVAATAENRMPIQSHQAPWVRTANGWERAHWLAPKPNFHAVPVHPARVSWWMGVAAAAVLGCGIGAQSKAKTQLPCDVQVAKEDRV